MSMEYPLDRAGKIRFIAEHYCLKEQLGQTREECAELIVATSKFDRAKTGLDQIRAMEQITEEMVDVWIMLLQLKELLGNGESLPLIMERKLDRQIERIHEELTGETEA